MGDGLLFSVVDQVLFFWGDLVGELHGSVDDYMVDVMVVNEDGEVVTRMCLVEDGTFYVLLLVGVYDVYVLGEGCVQGAVLNVEIAVG